MAEIEEVECIQCGWSNMGDIKIPRKCPECGAGNPRYAKKKIFCGDLTQKTEDDTAE